MHLGKLPVNPSSIMTGAAGVLTLVQFNLRLLKDQKIVLGFQLSFVPHSLRHQLGFLVLLPALGELLHRLLQLGLHHRQLLDALARKKTEKCKFMQMELALRQQQPMQMEIQKQVSCRMSHAGLDRAHIEGRGSRNQREDLDQFLTSGKPPDHSWTTSETPASTSTSTAGESLIRTSEFLMFAFTSKANEDERRNEIITDNSRRAGFMLAYMLTQKNKN